MPKKTLLIVIPAIVVILGLVLALFLWRKALEPSPEGKKFELLNINPPLAPGYLYGQSLQITFTFNQPVDLKTFSYSLSPKTQVLTRASVGREQVTLSPEGPWPEGNFALILSKKTKSLAGERLDRDYSYRFSVGRDAHGSD